MKKLNNKVNSEVNNEIYKIKLDPYNENIYVVVKKNRFGEDGCFYKDGKKYTPSQLINRIINSTLKGDKFIFDESMPKHAVSYLEAIINEYSRKR